MLEFDTHDVLVDIGDLLDLEHRFLIVCDTPVDLCSGKDANDRMIPIDKSGEQYYCLGLGYDTLFDAILTAEDVMRRSDRKCRVFICEKHAYIAKRGYSYAPLLSVDSDACRTYTRHSLNDGYTVFVNSFSMSMGVI